MYGIGNDAKSGLMFWFALSITAFLSIEKSHAASTTFTTGKLFDLTIGVDARYDRETDRIIGGIQSPTIGFGTVKELLDQSRSSSLSGYNGAYNSSSAAVVRLTYRGAPLVLSAEEDSSALTLFIPALGESVMFDRRSSRDENLEDVKDYLKSRGGRVLNLLQKELAKVSPVDPIAGNPGSMQFRMVQDDFELGFMQQATTVAEKGGDSASQSGNAIGIDISHSAYDQGGFRTRATTIPLSYVFRSDIDPGRQLKIHVPVSVIEVNGARSYGAQLGVSYRLPIHQDWALTPAVGYGVAGSVDLGSGAAMLALSLTSQYTWRFDGFDLAMGNMVGVYRSQKFSVNGYSTDPGIRNTVLRNGVVVSRPLDLLSRRMSMEMSLIHTHYSGTDLYSRRYVEVGLTLGTSRTISSSRGFFRAGLSYLRGERGIHGARVNVGAWF